MATASQFSVSDIIWGGLVFQDTGKVPGGLVTERFNGLLLKTVL